MALLRDDAHDGEERLAGNSRELDAADADAALIAHAPARNGANEGGLTRTTWAGHADEGMGRHVKVHTVKGFHFGI